MPVVLLEGFEGQNSDTFFWGGSGAAETTVTHGASVSRGGKGALAIFSTGAVMWRYFENNLTEGRPVQVRELTVLYSQSNAGMSGTVALRVQPGIDGSRQFGSAISTGGAVQLQRNTTTVASGETIPVNVNIYNELSLSVFIDSSEGWAVLTEGNNETPVLSVNSTNTQGQSADYANCLTFGRSVVTGDAFRLDDIIVMAPAVELQAGATGNISAGETITGADSGATAKVSDYDPEKRLVWVYGVQGVFEHGEAITGGTLSGAVVNAPHAAYVDGLAPNSGLEWVDPDNHLLGSKPISASGHYILRRSPTQDGAVTELTPSVGDDHYAVVGTPEDLTTFNEASGTPPLKDQLEGFASLPPYAAAVNAITRSVVAVGGGGFGTLDMLLSDSKGTQGCENVPLPSSGGNRVTCTFDLSSDGASWSRGDIVDLSTEIIAKA